MLANFFELNEPFEEFDEQALVTHLLHGSDIRDVLYRPDEWPADKIHRIDSATFTNVSLSKTVIRQVTFSGCTFRDCLFIGTTFEEVEFHGCKFIDCNLNKVEFRACYIDPASFEFDRSYQKTASNVVLYLYHELYRNATDARQGHWAATADFRFRQWKRAQLNYDLDKGRISKFQKLRSQSGSDIYEYVAGFGYRPVRFMICTVIAFLFISLLNWVFVYESFLVNGHLVSNITLIDSIFYTFSMMTVLGFSFIVPVAATAKLLAVLLALLGVGWMGIFTALLVKRFLR